MTAIYRVKAHAPLHHSDPLHVNNFYPDIQRFHRDKMLARQDLILYLADLHSTAMRSGMPRAMCSIQMRLTSLRDWVGDYRTIFDHFFEVQTLGYFVSGDKQEISTIIPRVLSTKKAQEASKSARNLLYVVPPLPEEGTVISKVYIQKQNEASILKRLKETGRFELRAPVQWLLDVPGGEVNFHFQPSGKLQQRDTSVWPVQSVETWPSWLRESLFGQGIDIDSAYTQFLVQHLRDAQKESPGMIRMFPDLIRSLEDKAAWRREICVDVLGLEPNDDNISLVKKLCMSLANGSRISPTILKGSRAFSVTADMVFFATNDVSQENLDRIGTRLKRIANQYSSARKIICSHLLNKSCTRKNQKEVFKSYFIWEREARYMIWNAIGQHGVMVHDGIDGIPKDQLSKLPQIMEELKLRLTT